VFHLSIYCYLNVSSVPLCVLVLDSSNPCALSAKDILILFPSIERGGWVLIKRSMSANKKMCRPAFPLGCTWCHKAHCGFFWFFSFDSFDLFPCFLLYIYADSFLIWSLVAVCVTLRHCLWMGKCCLCPWPDLHVLAVITDWIFLFDLNETCVVPLLLWT